MSGFPFVSVIMGVRYVRTDLRLLERAVRSILDQTYSNLELQICDDGSSLQAKEWLEDVSRKDKRLILTRNGTCLDLARKLNLCLGASTGEYIARMDDDDWSCPNRLEKQIQFLQREHEAAFVGCNVRLCRNSEIIGERKLPSRPIVEDFYFVQPFIHPTLVFRREALESVGGYSERSDCVLCEDYDLLLRMYGMGLWGANMQECLLDYTVPASAKGGRTIRHRYNETVTRWRRFKELGKLPGALPYVIKPLAVGLIPENVLRRMKLWRSSFSDQDTARGGEE